MLIISEYNCGGKKKEYLHFREMATHGERDFDSGISKSSIFIKEM